MSICFVFSFGSLLIHRLQTFLDRTLDHRRYHMNNIKQNRTANVIKSIIKTMSIKMGKKEKKKFNKPNGEHMSKIKTQKNWYLSKLVVVCDVSLILFPAKFRHSEFQPKTNIHINFNISFSSQQCLLIYFSLLEFKHKMLIKYLFHTNICVHKRRMMYCILMWK